MRKASLMGLSIRRIWARQHQTDAQNSAMELTEAKVIERSIVLHPHFSLIQLIASKAQQEMLTFCKVIQSVGEM